MSRPRTGGARRARPRRAGRCYRDRTSRTRHRARRIPDRERRRCRGRGRAQAPPAVPIPPGRQRGRPRGGGGGGSRGATSEAGPASSPPKAALLYARMAAPERARRLVTAILLGFAFVAAALATRLPFRDRTLFISDS